MAATYAGGRDRSAARVPQLSAESSSPVGFYWASEPFQVGVYGGWKFTVRPLDPGAPPPPGLDRWPAPGESIVSPQLNELMKTGRTPYTYLGNIVGFIEPAGLTNSAEIVAYTNPPTAKLKVGDTAMQLMSGFGQADPGWGSTVDDPPLPVFLVMYTLLLLLPAVGLFIAGILVGNGARARRIRQLKLLGAHRYQLVQWQLTRRVLPVIVGSVLASGVLLALMLTDVPIPGTSLGNGIRFEVTASDLQSHIPEFAVAWILSATLAALLAVWIHPLPKDQARTASDANRQVSRRKLWAARVCGLLLLLSLPGALALGLIRTNDQQVMSFLSEFQSWWAMGTLAVIAATLPAFIEIASLRIIRRLRLGSADELLGAGWLSRSRHHAVVSSGALGVLLIVLSYSSTQVQMYAGSAENRAIVALETASTVTARPEYGEPVELGLIKRLQARGWDVIALDFNFENATSIMFGESSLITATPTTTGCRFSTQVPGLTRALSSHQFADCARPWSELPSDPGMLQLVVTEPSGALDIAALTELLAAYEAPALSVYPLDTGGGGFSETRALWIRIFGLAGISLAIAALFLLSVADIRQASRNAASYIVLGANRPTVIAAMAWRTLTPVLIAVGAASVYAYQSFRLAERTAQLRDVTLQYHDIAYFVGLVLALVLISWLAGSADALRTARHWTPGRSRE